MFGARMKQASQRDDHCDELQISIRTRVILRVCIYTAVVKQGNTAHRSSSGTTVRLGLFEWPFHMHGMHFLSLRA